MGRPMGSSGVRTVMPSSVSAAARISSMVTSGSPEDDGSGLGREVTVTPVYSPERGVRARPSDPPPSSSPRGEREGRSTVPVTTQELEQDIAARPRRASRVDAIRRTYGFDDVSLAPGVETIEPSEVDTSIDFAGLHMGIPVLASAMDAVV